MAFLGFPELSILIGSINQTIDNPINSFYIATGIESIQVLPRPTAGSRLAAPVATMVYDAVVVFEVRRMGPVEAEQAIREVNTDPALDPSAGGLIVPMQDVPSFVM